MAIIYLAHDTNTVSTCDSTRPKDMSPTASTTAQVLYNNVFDPTWSVVATYDAAVSGDNLTTGDYDVRLNYGTFLNIECRFKLQEIDSTNSCSVENESSYSATHGPTLDLIHDETLALTWSGAGDILRLVWEGQETGGTPKAVRIDVNNTNDTSVTAPQAVASTGPKQRIFTIS